MPSSTRLARHPVKYIDVDLSPAISRLTITSNPAQGLPSITLDGPQETLDALTTTTEATAWHITAKAPQTGPHTHSQTGVSNYIGNVAPGATIIQMGNSYGSTFTNQDHNTLPDIEPATLHLIVHPNTTVTCEGITTEVEARGPFQRLENLTENGPLIASDISRIIARSTAGACHLTNVNSSFLGTVSGHLHIGGGTKHKAETVSGAVVFLATQDATLRAKTTSGNITVSRHGYDVHTHLSTVSGTIHEH